MNLEPLPNLFGEPTAPTVAPSDGRGEQLGLLEIAPTSIFSAPAPRPLPSDRSLF